MHSHPSRSLALVLWLAISSCTAAPTGTGSRDAVPPVTQTVTPTVASVWSQRAPAEDLRPLSRNFDDYPRFVRRVLLPADAQPAAAMVCRPSFADEFAASLVPPAREGHSPSTNSALDEPWDLVVTRARIGNGRAGGGSDWRRLDPDEFTVNRRSVPLDAAWAREISQAVQTATRRARNPAPQYAMQDGKRIEVAESLQCDGTSYDFEAGDYFATTNVCGEGPAADLAALFQRLAQAVDEPSVLARDELLEDCALRARSLNARMETLRW